MNRKYIWTAALILSVCLLPAAPSGKKMYVCVETLQVKNSTGFFAQTAGALAYGDEVLLLQEKGKWAEISSASNPSLRGWVSSSGLTSKKIIRGSTGQAAVSASADELALAGKGFSAEVEKSYREKTGADYSALDRMERETVAPEELLMFITEGKLKEGGQ